MSERPITSNLQIRVAGTEEEKRAVYRLRYDIYVEEMGRYKTVTNHKNRKISADADEQSRISYATLEGEVGATGRLT